MNEVKILENVAARMRKRHEKLSKILMQVDKKEDRVSPAEDIGTIISLSNEIGTIEERLPGILEKIHNLKVGTNG